MIDTPTDTPADTASDPIREQYSEHSTDGGVVAVIADPQNDQAWIESSLTYPVQQ